MVVGSLAFFPPPKLKKKIKKEKLLLNKHEKIIFPGPGHACVDVCFLFCPFYPTAAHPQPLFVYFGLLSSSGNAVLVQSSCHIDAFACQTIPDHTRPYHTIPDHSIPDQTTPDLHTTHSRPCSRPDSRPILPILCFFAMVTYHDFSINSTSMRHFAH